VDNAECIDIDNHCRKAVAPLKPSGKVVVVKP